MSSRGQMLALAILDVPTLRQLSSLIIAVGALIELATRAGFQTPTPSFFFGGRMDSQLSLVVSASNLAMSKQTFWPCPL